MCSLPNNVSEYFWTNSCILKTYAKSKNMFMQSYIEVQEWSCITPDKSDLYRGFEIYEEFLSSDYLLFVYLENEIIKIHKEKMNKHQYCLLCKVTENK